MKNKLILMLALCLSMRGINCSTWRDNYYLVPGIDDIYIMDYQDWKLNILNSEQQINYLHFTAAQKDKNFLKVLGGVQLFISAVRKIKGISPLIKKEYLHNLLLQYKEAQAALPLITNAQNRTDAKDALKIAEPMEKEVEIFLDPKVLVQITPPRL